MEEKNLILLESLIPKDEKFYVWCYDAKCQFLATTCPEKDQEPLRRAFEQLGGAEKLALYAQEASTMSPRIIGSSIGLQWAFSYESERNRDRLFVAGPVFYAAPDLKGIRSALLALNAPWVEALLPLLPTLPVMSYAIFGRYVLMLHNVLTGQQLGLEALQEGQTVYPDVPLDPVGERNRIQIYRAERVLLDMVREGNIDYQRALDNSALRSSGVQVQGRDPLRQAKTSVIVFTSLVCRAAMEGGLSPETAYALGDSYIQLAEDCRDSGELSALSMAMYHDFIYRVHYLKSDTNYSHAIQKCCDYIELSLTRRIRASDLASLVGYTEYYLTEKFKKETGKTVTRYIRDAKINRARMMLEATEYSVAEIAERLAFNTPNYFIQCFREVEGCTPAQYRKSTGNLSDASKH